MDGGNKWRVQAVLRAEGFRPAMPPPRGAAHSTASAAGGTAAAPPRRYLTLELLTVVGLVCGLILVALCYAVTATSATIDNAPDAGGPPPARQLADVAGEADWLRSGT